MCRGITKDIKRRNSRTKYLESLLKVSLIAEISLWTGVILGSQNSVGSSGNGVTGCRERSDMGPGNSTLVPLQRRAVALTMWLAPFLLRAEAGSCGRLGAELRSGASVAPRSSYPGLFRAAGIEAEAAAAAAAAAPLTAFSLPGSLQAVASARPGPLVPGQSQSESSKILFG